MKTIYYTIRLLSDWHVSSGLSGGVNADIITLKDNNRLPYIPGKTIKGLLREALEEINEVQKEKCAKTDIERLFGEKKESGDATKKNDFGTNSFFSNAELPQIEKKELTDNKLQACLYRNISSTTIDEQGVAKSKSLRAMEVCIPIRLEGEISGVSDEDIDLLKMAMRWIRRLGMKRNRGFGKCIFELKNKEQ